MHPLERLVGTALVDPRFCEALLDGHREEVVASFDLTPAERAIILRIEAKTLAEFARMLDQTMKSGEGEKSAQSGDVEASLGAESLHHLASHRPDEDEWRSGVDNPLERQATGPCSACHFPLGAGGADELMDLPRGCGQVILLVEDDPAVLAV